MKQFQLLSFLINLTSSAGKIRALSALMQTSCIGEMFCLKPLCTFPNAYLKLIQQQLKREKKCYSLIYYFQFLAKKPQNGSIHVWVGFDVKLPSYMRCQLLFKHFKPILCFKISNIALFCMLFKFSWSLLIECYMHKEL